MAEAEKSSPEDIIQTALDAYAAGTYVRGFKQGSRYERFNTPDSLTEYFLTKYADLFKGCTIFDPCADVGRVLDCAQRLGFGVKGSDCLPSEHPLVEQQNLYDITEKQFNCVVITIFRWGSFDGVLAKHMMEHMASLGPVAIVNTRCPKELTTWAPEGYTLVEAKKVPAEEYICIAEDALESNDHYWACVWIR